jgi:hypothetical protein
MKSKSNSKPKNERNRVNSQLSEEYCGGCDCDVIPVFDVDGSRDEVCPHCNFNFTDADAMYGMGGKKVCPFQEAREGHEELGG